MGAAERGRLVSWIKVGLIAVGALIAFVIVQSVLGLLRYAFIALVIAVAIALALKARSQYRIAKERRAQVRQEKAQDKAQRKAQVQERRTGEVAAPEWMPEQTAQTAPPQPAAVPRHHDVEDELARLKREMGA
jgi:choline-glycine betaine transporter